MFMDPFTVITTTQELMGLGNRGILQEADGWEVRDTDMPACTFETGSILADINIILKAKEYGHAIAMAYYNFMPIK